MRRIMTMFAGCVLAVAGCGGGGSEELSEPQAELAAGFQDSFNADPASAESISQTDAECASNDIARVFTDERIDELGLTREAVSAGDFNFDGPSLTADEQAGVTEALSGCIDFEQVFVEALSQDGQLSDESITCLVDTLPDDYFDDALASGFTAADPTAAAQEDQAVLFEALSQCVSDEEFPQFGG